MDDSNPDLPNKADPLMIAECVEVNNLDNPINVQHQSLKSLLARWGDLQEISPNYVTAERLSNWIAGSIVLIVGWTAVPIYSYWMLGIWSVLIPLWISTIAITMALLWVVHVVPRLTYRNVRWRFTEAGFEISKGIFWKHTVSIPMPRVQHTDVAQGPIARKFKIAKLILHTAGTATPSIELEGLPVDIAHSVRDSIIQHHTFPTSVASVPPTSVGSAEIQGSPLQAQPS